MRARFSRTSCVVTLPIPPARSGSPWPWTALEQFEIGRIVLRPRCTIVATAASTTADVS